MNQPADATKLPELLPCPFCGSYEASTFQPEEYRTPGWVAYCMDCGAEARVGGSEREKQTEAQAIAAWNRRAQAGRTETPVDPIDDLVARFGAALSEKLKAARAKYGRGEDWLATDWRADCVREMHRHIAKGDPRDVAAYCAFMWHHGWRTEADPDLVAERDGYVKAFETAHGELMDATRDAQAGRTAAPDALRLAVERYLDDPRAETHNDLAAALAKLRRDATSGEGT